MENWIFKEQLDKSRKKLCLTDRQRCSLAKRVKKLLQEYTSIASQETVMGWHRRLEALNSALPF